MKKLIIPILLPAVCAMAGCKGQINSNNNKKDTAMITNIEKFDFEDYKKRMAKSPLGFIYTKDDSTKVMMGDGEVPFIRETPPPPKFYQIYKEFYANGNIKEKGAVIIRSGVKIGKWEYYDNRGNKTIVDEDKKFGKFNYNDVLKFMEKEGHINLSTGAGRDLLNIYYESNPILDTKKWTADYTDIPHGKFYEYVINGETGQVVSRQVKEVVD